MTDPDPIRLCRDDERSQILEIVNAAAEAYRGVIPADRWHEPYMDGAELDAEIAAGVAFSGCVIEGRLVGVMGVQAVRDVALIRHAFVRPGIQGRGIGGALLAHLRGSTDRRVLVGTWAPQTGRSASTEATGLNSSGLRRRPGCYAFTGRSPSARCGPLVLAVAPRIQ